jgi:hypothetical protein
MPRRKPSAKKRKKLSKQPVAARKKRLFLPWPIILFILLCVGVLLIGWTFQAAADNLRVTAKVSAPLPSGPAIITSPGDGTHFTDVPITVAGTCPVDTYIKLYRNDFFSGTVVCSADGNFELQTDLFPGANQLKARIFNITDDEGPMPTPITVYYDVPEQPTAGGTAESNQSSGPSAPGVTGHGQAIPTVPPFTINTDYKYLGYKVGQDIDWTLELAGGVPPYALNVEWGDGSNSVISQKQAGKITVRHRYKEAGNGPRSSFLIKISGSDAVGHQSFLQLFIIIKIYAIPNVVANNLPSAPHISKNWLAIAWPAYTVTLLMAFSFWLGEKEELIVLSKRGLARKLTHRK